MGWGQKVHYIGRKNPDVILVCDAACLPDALFIIELKRICFIIFDMNTLLNVLIEGKIILI